MPLLSAAELKAHPYFNKLEWDLPSTKEGKCPVAKGRGGPFDLWYEVHGTGNTKLVWIMGLGAYRTQWKRQTKYFGHTPLNASKYSSLVFDNRGMGKSDKPTVRYTTSEMAKDVIDLVDHLGWKGPRSLHVIGVSMGGMIAQELGLLIPERIASLVLVSTAPRLVRTVPFIENLRQRINMFVPRDIDVQLDEITKRLFSQQFLDRPDTEGNFATNGDRIAAAELDKRMDKEGFTKKGFMLQAIAAGWHYKSAEQLAELRDKVGAKRIMIMHGTGDNMLTFVHGELLHKELGEEVRWRTWPGLGHVLMIEVEDEFNKEVQEFVEQNQQLKSS